MVTNFCLVYSNVVATQLELPGLVPGPVHLVPRASARLAPRPSWVHREELPRNRLVAIDLFAGCGGFSLGLEMAGYAVWAACEVDPFAAYTYRCNFPHVRLFEADIREMTYAQTSWRPPRLDLLVAGLPCQPFSTLNRHRGARDARRWLGLDFLRALDALRPRAFVIENVATYARSHEADQLRHGARDLGYHVGVSILDSVDFGVAQRRRRAFLAGSLGEPVQWPLPSHGGAEEQPHITVAQALAGLPLIPNGHAWHSSRPKVKDSSLVRYRAVPRDGGDRFAMAAHLDADDLGHLVPVCWRGHRRVRTDVFGRMWWDRPAPTIRTEFYKPEKGRYLHPTEDRPITLREGARLQSFPDEFAFPTDMTMNQVARQIGNAVPPLLARAVGTALASALRTRRGRALA